ncbi:MAG: hypothetical protein IH991_03470 [Planctomycetes bacterium]|nr:hypothetical protein [Planctomycetota bacterium]
MSSQVELPDQPKQTDEVGAFIERLADEIEYYDGSERRTEARRRVVVPVMVMPVDDNFERTGDAFQAVTRDVSTSGISLLSTQDIDAEYLAVFLKTLSGRELIVVIHVCRHDYIGVYYDIAGTFVHTLKVDKKAQRRPIPTLAEQASASLAER